MFRSTAILPHYAPSQAFNGGVGEYFVPNGMGEYFVPTSGLGQFNQASAGITGIGALCPNGCGIGVGQLDEQGVATGAALGGAVIGLGLLALWIYMGYKIGEDLSPNGRNWGVGGAFVSLLGPFSHYGYGIMALSNGR